MIYIYIDREIIENKRKREGFIYASWRGHNLFALALTAQETSRMLLSPLFNFWR